MKVIKRIAPLQMGKVLACLYAFLSIILIPIIFISALRKEEAHPIELLFMLGVLPLIYIAVGFVGGIIVAALYNLVAKFVGGVKITLEDEEISQS